VGRVAEFYRLHEYFFISIMVHMKVCHACGQGLDPNLSIVRSSLCPACGRDLKVCLNCVFYSPTAHWECRESISERVAEKDKANFCDWFRFKDSTGAGPERPNDHKVKEDFFKLFGNE
jgi:predicted RNA-binding Zn-ribbon protein involved in translation (DUF1610 family)